MPKIDIAKLPVDTVTNYPDPFWQADRQAASESVSATPSVLASSASI